jgi:hypothetical protein
VPLPHLLLADAIPIVSPDVHFDAQLPVRRRSSEDARHACRELYLWTTLGGHVCELVGGVTANQTNVSILDGFVREVLSACTQLPYVDVLRTLTSADDACAFVLIPLSIAESCCCPNPRRRIHHPSRPFGVDWILS